MNTTTVRIAVLDDYQNVAESAADWRGRLPEAEITYFHENFGEPATLIEALKPFDVVVAMRERAAFPVDVFDGLPQLKLLVTTGMRNVAIDLDAAAAHGVVVSGTRGNIWGTSELAWALIMGLMRGIAPNDVAMRTGRWQETVGRELHGQTLGVLGLGKQGSRVASIGRAFGMDVVAWSPNLAPERAAAENVRFVQKDELFSSSDVVTIHLVLSDATHGLVGEPELRALGQESFLVNTSRAGLVDSTALASALNQGLIAGAGLDVFDIEPLPADHWLRSAPRTLLSPHVGYVTTQNYAVFYGDAVDGIEQFLKGTPVREL